jgi:hypothetical protein
MISLYETDIKNPMITITEDDINEPYLDYNIIIYNNSKRIKAIWSNKNEEVRDIGIQPIARLFDKHLHYPYKYKLSAITNVLLRVYTRTTYQYDMLLPVLDVFYECIKILGYNTLDLTHAILAVQSIQPSHIWNLALSHFL